MEGEGEQLSVLVPYELLPLIITSGLYTLPINQQWLQVITVYLIGLVLFLSFRDQLIFWTDVLANNIMSSNFNGSEVATIANLSAQAIPGMLCSYYKYQ